VTFEQWDVVVVPFPFADRATTRRRPALVVSRADSLGSVVGHHVLAMITSARHQRWPLDVPLEGLEAAGLPAPSVVRMKIFTLDARLIERRAGTLQSSDAAMVKDALRRLCGDTA
jgi:mRNA interferase MazF